MKIPFLNWGKRNASAAPPEAYPTKRKRTLWGGGTLGGMFKSSAVTGADAWPATPVSPDQFITRRQMSLVARSREQWSNNDYVRAFIRIVRQNVIGPKGITLQAQVKKPRGALDKESNAAIEAEWLDWSKRGNCEVTGELSWRQVQLLVVETAARDGEFFARKIFGADAGPHGFAIQLIDPQRLPVWYENYNMDTDGSFIRHGIEFNKYGKPQAYHFASTNEWAAYFYTYAGMGFERIPADQIIHCFVHEMIGQRRGLPWASTSLFRLHHLQGFEDAAVQNARASATKMGFIQYRDGFGPEAEEDMDVAASIDAEPLSFHELPEGAELKDWNPTYPSGEFQTFHKAMLRGAFAGMGAPYNTGSGDLEGVNFSSIRQGELDAREHWKELQGWVIDSFIQPIYQEWIKWKLLRGDIKVRGVPLDASKLDIYGAAEWHARRWDWIDPKSDTTAKVEMIRAGLTSQSQVIRELGHNPDKVAQELAEDIARLKAAGVPDEFISVIFGILPAPDPSPNHADESAAKETAK